MRKAIGKAFLRLGEILALGYDAGDSSRARRDLGWGRRTARDEDSMAGVDGTRETVRLKGTNLRRNNPIIAGICERLASFTVGTGILPQAKTKDRVWNKAAEQWWAEWSKVCDVRGRATLWDLQWQAVALRPVHGGLYLELLKNGQVRPIECERIRNPKNPTSVKAFTDGVRVHRGSGVVLGYQVHARDSNGGFGGKHAERFVKRENMVAVIRPPWRPDQVREIPDLAPVIPVMQDIHEMNTHTLNTAKVQSMIIAALKKQGGQGLNSMPRGTTSPTVGSRQTFKFDWGQILELFTGEDLAMHVSPTPGKNHIPYIKLELLLAAAALDVPYEFFTLDFSTADYSRMKAVLLLVNKTMRNWQKWLSTSQWNMNQRLWNWRTAKAMKPGGDLAPAPRNEKGVSQWFRVEWQPPEEPWADRQEANQADVLEWQIGLGPLSAASKRRGRDLEDALREKAANLKLADEIEKEFKLPAGTLIKAQIPGQTDSRAKTEVGAGSAREEGRENA